MRRGVAGMMLGAVVVSAPVPWIVRGNRVLEWQDVAVKASMKARVRKLKHVNRLLWRAVDSEGLAVAECERDLAGRRKHVQ